MNPSHLWKLILSVALFLIAAFGGVAFNLVVDRIERLEASSKSHWQKAERESEKNACLRERVSHLEGFHKAEDQYGCREKLK